MHNKRSISLGILTAAAIGGVVQLVIKAITFVLPLLLAPLFDDELYMHGEWLQYMAPIKMFSPEFIAFNLIQLVILAVMCWLLFKALKNIRQNKNTKKWAIIVLVASMLFAAYGGIAPLIIGLLGAGGSVIELIIAEENKAS